MEKYLYGGVQHDHLYRDPAFYKSFRLEKLSNVAVLKYYEIFQGKCQ